MTSRKSVGYWVNESNAKSELRKVIKKLGRLPRFHEMNRECPGLGNALSRYHDGLEGIAPKLGYEINRKRGSYWEQFDNVISEVRKVMKKHRLKEIPSKRFLAKIGENTLAVSIVGYHGGFRRLRKTFGEKKIRAASGAWKDRNYAIAQAREMMKKHGFETLPQKDVALKLGYGDLVKAIYNHHNGYQAFRELLGEKNPYVKRGTWSSLDNCVQTVIDVMKANNLREVPNGNYLGKLGYNGLASAIGQKHGGAETFTAEVKRRLGMRSEDEELSSLLEKYAGGNSNE